MSPRRKGGALVEFSRQCDAELAFSIEKGHDSRPLQLAWIKGDDAGSGDAAPPPGSQVRYWPPLFCQVTRLRGC